MSEENPEVVQIQVSELKEWLEHVTRGLEPVVTFDGDNAEKMQHEAYRVRGSALAFINNRIRFRIHE